MKKLLVTKWNKFIYNFVFFLVIAFMVWAGFKVSEYDKNRRKTIRETVQGAYEKGIKDAQEQMRKQLQEGM